ncbi:MBL fold metallo-hydrolase [Amycolatopsis magusensis]|uniref:Glyoxylase-like metal-dependent hydrolase (Beta-lactamase superfamily II) n=1 Tax=Amycolatopsis magusensis TaxID=882444 RepID=A0ABS4PTL1_9PSEU|nr:MBL fold metallo-hydrolase [Amycolatopsis magusensis]MBP2182225.1 glyoxylase-like metal-dependent hydrolase (beta-lactamase superfamily II) [Amycolatopsis magusensis]
MKDSSVQRSTLGDVELIRLIEWHEPFLPAADFLPDVPPEVWERNAWLAPDHWDPATGRTVIALQTWVLHSAGVRREDVDLVVNTHLHVDHVGWNTFGAVGMWEPTFPNAEYLIPAADDAHYGPDNVSGAGLQAVDRLIYEDSVAPIHRAGQAVLWDGFHRIDEHLVLESAPGHTRYLFHSS